MIRITILSLLLCFHLSALAGSVRVLAWDDSIAARKLALVSGSEVTEIIGMHPEKRTRSITYKADVPLVLRAMDKPPGADGKPIDLLCNIPEAVKVPLLVILPDETHATGTRLLIVDDNPEGFRWGTFRFLNATPKELILQLENKAVRIPIGWKPVDLNIGGEIRGMGARIALAESIEKPLYSAVWEYDPDVRTVCFLVPGTDERLSPVAFKAVPENRKFFQMEKPADTRKP